MSIVKIVVPAMGEGITDVTVTKWLVKEGEKVIPDQPLVEIATDKVDSEIYAAEPGQVLKILKNTNEVVDIGEPVALMECNENNLHNEEKNNNFIETVLNIKSSDKYDKDIEIKSITTQKHRFIAPFLRSLAISYNIPTEELYSIKGTGKDNMLTLSDVKKYILRKNTVKNHFKNSPVTSVLTDVKENLPLKIDQDIVDNSEVIEMDHMRKIIARHMVFSKSISPHVTSFIEADVTSLVAWKKKIKDKFIGKYGEKLTYTPVFIEAVVKALKKYPLVNASLDNDKIYIKKNINIGVATALTNGNLIVPVIRDADKKNIPALANEINEIVHRARNNNLVPTEIKGGTFTITNLGNFESLAGTPIINQPEVAILAIGAIKRKPAVVVIDSIETIGIRDIVVLSLAYDHRIIDGSLGGMFLKYIKDALQEFDINRQV